MVSAAHGAFSGTAWWAHCLEFSRRNGRTIHSIASQTMEALVPRCSRAMVHFWLASEDGLEIFDRRAGQVSQRITIEAHGRAAYLATFPATLYQDHSGLIWTGLSSGGDLASIDPKSGAATIYSLRGAAFSGNAVLEVVSMLEDRDGNLWLCTRALGLLKLDRERKHAVWFKSDPDDPPSLGGELVVSLASDREGSFWAVTKGGDVYRFDPHPQAFRFYRRRPGDRNSLIDN
jgi:streptogramin lyase